MDLDALQEFLGPAWLVWLVVLFCGVMFWVFRPANRERLEGYGAIPLNDDFDGGKPHGE